MATHARDLSIIHALHSRDYEIYDDNYHRLEFFRYMVYIKFLTVKISSLIHRSLTNCPIFPYFATSQLWGAGWRQPTDGRFGWASCSYYWHRTATFFNISKECALPISFLLVDNGRYSGNYVWI